MSQMLHTYVMLFLILNHYDINIYNSDLPEYFK